MRALTPLNALRFFVFSDLVKVRLQAEGRLPPGSVRQYSGTLDAYRKIIARDGIRGLWRGYVPNVARNSTINAAELASYDQIKQTILRLELMEDSVPCHLLCGASAGFIATVIGSPVDVVKTRMMSTENGVKIYNSVPDCLRRSFQSGGFASFYQGFWANFARIGLWNITMFLVCKQLFLFLLIRILEFSVLPFCSDLRASSRIQCSKRLALINFEHF
jgi:solute carrier family 25 uncoupling protein 8/9